MTINELNRITLEMLLKTMGNETSAFICGDSRRRRLPKCQFCHTRDGENQCDYPTGGKCRKCRGIGRHQMPDYMKRTQQGLAQIIEEVRELPKGMTMEEAREHLANVEKAYQCHDCAGTGKAQCNRYFCGTTCGLRISDEEGYCPSHQMIMYRMPCEWIESPLGPSKCFRKRCLYMIHPGERCLFFPERQRAMDVACGEAYLKLTEVTQ